MSELAGLSLTHAADQIGRNMSTISRWLNGTYAGNDEAIAAVVERWLDTRADTAKHSLEGAGLDRHAETHAARKSEGGAVLEFIVGSREENIQDKLALLGEHQDDARAEREVSLRMLRHLAISVHHQQYRGNDILTVRVEAMGG